MHDPRTRTALRQLADLGHEPDPPAWVWAIAQLEPSGRLLVPVGARAALRVTAGCRLDTWGRCRGTTLVWAARSGTTVHR